MDELRKKLGQNPSLPYLDNIAMIHKKHMQLLTDHMQHQSVRTNVEKRHLEHNNLLHSRPFFTEFEPPLPKSTKKETIQDTPTS